MRRALLLVSLVLVGWAAPARAQDPADEAWRAERLDEAERLYSARLARDSADARALHRLGLMLAWKERYAESLALFDRLLRVDPRNAEARVDRARVLAWRGDPAAAVAAVDEVLAGDPGNLGALQARAQFAGWAGQYDEALATYGRIQELTPGSRSVELDRARVLSWASRFPAARAVYDSLLRADPNDREALLGLAQVLAWSSQPDSAGAVYRRILATDPADVEARRGVARTAAWSGRLIEAERGWRAVLARQPNDPAALVGLSQTLRWQGRDAAALDAAERAVRAAPTDRDARTELQWVRRALAPRTSPSLTYESDSDGNRISTAAAGASYRPIPWMEVRGDGYARQARQEDSDVPEGRAYGASFSLWAQAEPGWALSGGVGAAASDRDGGETRPAWRAALSTPGRNPATATLAYRHDPLDGTALLIQRDVEVDEVSLAGQLSPGSGLVFALGGSWAEFQGNVSGETNRRLAGSLALTRRFTRFLTLGAAVRSFGFSRDLSDGYFDPDFYGIAEALGRFNREWRRWGVSAEAAPGVQQVGEDGEGTPTFRGNGGVTWIAAPGRRIGLSGVYANAGLSRLSATDTGEGYRYTAVILSATWSF